MTGKEARKQAKRKIAELRHLSKELSEILEELPIPTPEEFEAMRRGEMPWTEEAHVAAVIRNADFFVDEAVTTIADYAGRNTEWLNLIWRKGERPALSFERSLRYLVIARSGQVIPPSEAEVCYYDPLTQGPAEQSTFLDVHMKACWQFICWRLTSVDREKTIGEPQKG